MDLSLVYAMRRTATEGQERIAPFLAADLLFCSGGFDVSVDYSDFYWQIQFQVEGVMDSICASILPFLLVSDFYFGRGGDQGAPAFWTLANVREQ